MFAHQDYQEEISVAQENKQQLQVMGERLARASQDSKATEIQHKLNKVSERWQHLLDLIAARWVYETCRKGPCPNQKVKVVNVSQAVLKFEQFSVSGQYQDIMLN